MEWTVERRPLRTKTLGRMSSEGAASEEAGPEEASDGDGRRGSVHASCSAATMAASGRGGLRNHGWAERS